MRIYIYKSSNYKYQDNLNQITITGINLQLQKTYKLIYVPTIVQANSKFYGNDEMIWGMVPFQF